MNEYYLKKWGLGILATGICGFGIDDAPRLDKRKTYIIN